MLVKSALTMSNWAALRVRPTLCVVTDDMGSSSASTLLRDVSDDAGLRSDGERDPFAVLFALRYPGTFLPPDQRSNSLGVWNNSFTTDRTSAMYVGDLLYNTRLFTRHFPSRKCHVMVIDATVANATASIVSRGGDMLEGSSFLRSMFALKGDGSTNVDVTTHHPARLFVPNDWKQLLETTVATPSTILSCSPMKAPTSHWSCDMTRKIPFAIDGLLDSLDSGSWTKVNLAQYDAFNELLVREAAKSEGLEGGSWQLIEERQLYITVAQLPFVKTICEIGFNAGHSAALWLRANPTAKVIMFDLFQHAYGRVTERMLRLNESLHGIPDVDRRLVTVEGSSLDTVPLFRKTHPEVSCDILSVDGGHFDDIPHRDVLNMRELASRGPHVLVIDDTNCEAHWCLAVNDAVNKNELEGTVAILSRTAEMPDVGKGLHMRGVTLLQYTPRAQGLPT